MNRTRLPNPIHQALRRLERRLFRVLFGFGLGRLLRNLTLLLGALYLLDRLIQPPTPVRLLLAFAALGIWLNRIRVELWRPLQSRLPQSDLAAIWERRCPHLGDRLVTAVELAADPKGASPAMLEVVTREAIEQCEQLDATSAVPTGKARRSLFSGLLAAAVLLLATLAFPDEAAVFGRRLMGSELAWPSRTTLHLMPAYVDGIAEPVPFQADGPQRFRLSVARGTTLSIRIRAEGEVPETVRMLGLPRTRQMHALGGGEFVLRLPPIQEDIELEFRGGDDVDGLPRLLLQAGDAPSMASWEVKTTPPAYSGLPGESGSFHELRALVGTTVEIAFEADRIVTEVEVGLDEDEMQPLQPDADGRYAFQFPVQADGKLRVAMVSEEGFRNDHAAQLRWLASPDRSPEPEFLFPTRSWVAVPGGRIPLVVQAMDDFGIEDWSLLQKREGREELPLALKPTDGARELRQVLRLPAPPLDSVEALTANRSRFRLQATDNARPLASSAQVDSAWIEVLPAAIEEQQLAERIIELREDLTALRERMAGYVDGPETPTASRARRWLKEMEGLLGEAEFLLLERLYSSLDRQTEELLPYAELLLLEGGLKAGQLTDSLSHAPVAAPLDRSGMLLDLCVALAATYAGPSEDWAAAIRDHADGRELAAVVVTELDLILKMLLTWEDYQSAINLLRDLLERQRGLFLRTREASGR